MLGMYVYGYLKRKFKDVRGVTRTEVNAESSDIISLDNFFTINGGVHLGDYIINCMGLIKQKMTDKDVVKAIKINSIFPYVLNDFCKTKYVNLIHISTDCVFQGHTGKHKENDSPEPEDIYGQTKLAGEPDCMVIRTSIIGEGVFKGSLLEWTIRQKTINGFTNHVWNGVTCLQLAKEIEDIILKGKQWRGPRHYFSWDVTKDQLVRDIAKVYDKDIAITSGEAPVSIDRTLDTEYKGFFNSVPDIMTQLEEQRQWSLTEK